MLKGPIDILKNDAAVMALVGLNEMDEKTKVFPVFCPQSESDPYIVLRQTAKATAAKGCANACGFDVYSYAKSYDEATAIDLAVVAALAGVNGVHNGVEISFINHANTRDEHVFEPKQLYVKVSSFEGMFMEQ